MKFIKYILSILFLTFTLGASENPSRLTTQEKLTHYLTELVRFKTLPTNYEENRRALLWVEQQLKPLNLNFRTHTFNHHPSLLITTQKTDTPKIWLIAHIDVVSGAESLFEPQIKEGKMFARGAYDMKMAIACYILLMQDLKEELGLYDFGLMLTSDEEIGGFNGVKQLLELGNSCSVALLPDGGFNWNFEKSAKGVLHLKISASGTSAHSSRPWMGDSAIDKLIDGLQDTLDFFHQQKIHYGDYFPTVNIGMIQGGKSVNQVADYAEATLDIRFPPSITEDEIQLAIENIVKKHKGLSVEKSNSGSSHHVNIEHPFFQKFRNIARSMYSIEIASTLSHGSSDARFFGEKNIPVLVIAPKGGEIHSDKEWVDLEDLARFYQVMKAWVMEVSYTGP